MITEATDTDTDTDVDVDLDLIARCEYDGCRGGDDNAAVAVVVNWCGCRILLCRPCVAAELSARRSFPFAIMPAAYTCCICGAERFGLVAELSRIVPI